MESKEELYQFISKLWKSGQELQINTLLQLTYPNGDDIVTLDRKDIIIEIVDMIMGSQEFEETLKFLSSAKNPDYVILENPNMMIVKKQASREIPMYEYDKVGIKGIGRCRKCGSEELLYAYKQTRSGDEPTTVKASCIMCGASW